MKRSPAFLLAIVALVGCGDSAENTSASSGLGVGGGSSTGTTTGTTTTTSGGPTSGSGGASPTSISGTIGSDTTVSGDVDVPSSVTIASGTTLTLAAGTTLHAASGASLIVQGTLAAQGTATAGVTMQSKPHTGAAGWVGIDLEGGTATLSYVAVHDATTALNAAAGSSYTIDHFDVDTSKLLMSLAADGSIDHGTLHGDGMNQSSDPIVVNNASPKLSNLLLDNLNAYTDYVQLNGGTPVFDHMDVSQCHCAFHFNTGTNATISNSALHDAQYGLMVVGASGTKVDGTNFISNSVNIGTCSGGSVIATGDYFDDAAFDASCAGQTNQSPVSAPLSSVGPQP